MPEGVRAEPETEAVAEAVAEAQAEVEAEAEAKAEDVSSSIKQLCFMTAYGPENSRGKSCTYRHRYR